MKDKIAKLIDVKSIVTFAVIGVMCYLAIKEVVDVAVFTAIASSIITYYFTRRDKDVKDAWDE